MWTGVVAVLASCILASSCGMVADERAGDADTSDLGPTTVVDRPTTTDAPTTTVLVLPEPGEGQETVPPVATEPVEPAQLSEADLAALDRCRRIATLQTAGYAVVIAAVDDRSAVIDSMDGLIDALEALRPILLPPSQATLDSVRQTLVDASTELSGSAPDGAVAELQTVIQGLAPQLIELLQSMQQLCPSAISPDTLDQPEKVRLGQPFF